MEFHPSKCQHITFSRKRQPDRQTLSLHGTEIPRAERIKYLGLTLDPKITWSTHIDNTTTKANSTLGFIRRNVLTDSTEVKATAYKQLVRPVMEYSSAALDSISNTASSRLEAVQRRAARVICGIRRTDRQTSTTSLLTTLNLQPLSERRSDRRMKIFSQYHHTNNTVLSRYTKRATTTSARRHPLQYLAPHSNSDHHRRSFFVRTAKEWNLLPADSNYLIPQSA